MALRAPAGTLWMNPQVPSSSGTGLEKTCARLLFVFRGFTISRAGTPRLLTPGPSNTRTPKCRNLPVTTFRLSGFQNSRFRDSGGRRFLVLQPPGSRNAEKGLTGFGSSLSLHPRDHNSVSMRLTPKRYWLS
jgi:hypothetical protein